jgi:hypothetical protein
MGGQQVTKVAVWMLLCMSPQPLLSLSLPPVTSNRLFSNFSSLSSLLLILHIGDRMIFNTVLPLIINLS